MMAVSQFTEIRIFRRVLESLDMFLNSRKQSVTPKARLLQDAWKKGANDAVIDKKQNPYPKGSDRFNSYEEGHKSQWWLN